MKRLSHSDWAAISSALPAIYSQRSPFNLACTWMKIAKEMVAADLVVSSELDTARFAAIQRPIAYPYDIEVVKLTPMFLELSGQVAEFQPGYAEGVLFGPLTSRMSQRRFERTDVFNAFHRPLGFRYQFAGFMPGLTPHVGFIVQRRSGDYSVRDEEILRHLSEHYTAAARNVQAFSLLASDNSSLTQANAIAGQGVVFLTRDYTLSGLTPLATKQLAKFFGASRNRTALPEPIRHWIREQLRKLGEQCAIGSPLQPLKAGSGTEVLIIRLVLDPIEHPMLLMTENASAVSVEVLARFGLTPRETEVLYWLVQGKTNGEIALLLGTREGTARKHVERILTHFGTQNRTATVSHVMEQLRS
jgi:DNA-binding CsgD family transcriptional regulator